MQDQEGLGENIYLKRLLPRLCQCIHLGIVKISPFAAGKLIVKCKRSEGYALKENDPIVVDRAEHSFNLMIFALVKRYNSTFTVIKQLYRSRLGNVSVCKSQAVFKGLSIIFTYLIATSKAILLLNVPLGC